MRPASGWYSDTKPLAGSYAGDSAIAGFAGQAELAAAYDAAVPLVYLHQLTTYYDIVQALEPGAR